MTTRAEIDEVDLQTIYPLLVLHTRLREQMLDGGVVLILPHLLLPGFTSIFGLEVLRAHIPAPMLGLPEQE